jgi:hypothetical protein
VVSHISRKTSEIWGTPIRGQDGVTQTTPVVLIEVKAVVGLRPSFSSHVRFGERGAPVDFLRQGSLRRDFLRRGSLLGGSLRLG